ncbi:glycogen/starch synthase [Pseudoalteromonas carrageenovora]|uniref:glycogen synthase n=1 Tax=Pseudoalteromonas TaxID=53246 RepID=UPI0007321B2D|nr:MULTISPECIES: glycogen/starch synthase [Pseudoalteromonas]KTF09048.1 glycogen synthase [Pseudoalteromonas sp. H103]MDO6635088.1 glycogen/starch synthase [Pseudoalteromonas carrageenovora]MDO6647596.1 glycogen/starch synthase [Pseudoalteromonas carrageenovora]
MHVLMVAAENDALPGAKVGGVADVVRDAPKALAEQGITVDVVIPDYGIHDLNRTHIGDVTVAFNAHPHVLTLFKVEQSQSNVTQIVISHPLFSNSGSVYCNDAPGRPFATDATKFALFNAAVCEALLQGVLKRPTALHLHDWHSACVAVLLKFEPRYQTLSNLNIAYTVHNIALQGIRPFKYDDSSLEAWFPSLSYDGQQLCDPRYPHCFNPMRSAINLANKVHLVSPTYSQEVLKPSNYELGFFGGEGLEQDLKNAADKGKLVGILNGCEYPNSTDKKVSMDDLYSQAQDTLFNWMAKTPQLESGYYIAHQRLQQFMASPVKGPLVTSVGRLTEQKVLLLCQSIESSLVIDEVCKIVDEFNGRVIILGSGDEALEEAFTKAMARNANLLFLKGYGQGVGDLMYQLGDLFLMPSSFEPCGISQMLAMRAGQPCLVHSVGGLKDTVKHNDNGFSFNAGTLSKQADSLLKCLDETLMLHKEQPKQWQKIKANAKGARFSWTQVATDYISYLYQ